MLRAWVSSAIFPVLLCIYLGFRVQGLGDCVLLQRPMRS